MAAKKYKKGPTGVSFAGSFYWPKVSEVDWGSDDYPKKDGQFSVPLKGRLDDPNVKAFIAKHQQMYDEAIERAKEEFKKLKPQVKKTLGSVKPQPLYKELYEEDGETPTGEVLFNFTMRYSGDYKEGSKKALQGIKKWFRVPQIFDAAGHNMKYWFTFRDGRAPKRNPKTPDIWGGTVGRVAYEIGLNKEGLPGYFIPATGAAGLSFKLEAVRILDLVTAGERSADSYGFDNEEQGGYTYSPEDAADAVDDDPTDTPAETSGSGQDDDDTDF
jgi:hypothetical protein